jgi:hypothetical protein
MRRRDFIWFLGGGVVACSIGCDDDHDAPASDAATGAGSGSGSAQEPHDGGVDACVQRTVTMHDTYAQALYLDDSLGPLTGVIQVAHVIAGTMITFDFWHGHGGVLHRFTLEPSHFEQLKNGERITLGTTTVEGHAHTLFIDPTDEYYRVPGAADVEVPIGC